MQAVTGSGMSVMSDSLIAFQPAMDDPSNITPSAKASSSTMDTSKVTCCHLPLGSVNRKSTYLTSLSLIDVSTSLAVFITGSILFSVCGPGQRSRARRYGRRRLDRVRARLAGADADRLLDRRYKNLAIADATSLRRLADRLHRAVHEIVRKDDLELHLGQEVDNVLGAAVQLGVTLLPPEPLRLDHRDALQAHLLKRFLDLVELERLDDRFNFLHAGSRYGLGLRSAAALSINARG